MGQDMKEKTSQTRTHRVQGQLIRRAGAVQIETASCEEADRLLEIYAPYVRNTAITFEYEVPSVEEFARRIRQVEERYPYLVARKDGRICGYAYAGPFKERAAYDWAVELSVYVDEKWTHQGIGKLLYQTMEEFLGKMGILNLEACIAVPPTREDDSYLTWNSAAYHAHMGYRLVGEFYHCGYKFHRWYNMVWMEKEIGDHQAYQPAPRPFPELLKKLD